MSQHLSSSTLYDSNAKKLWRHGTRRYERSYHSRSAYPAWREMGWLDGVAYDLPIAVWAGNRLDGDYIWVELASGKALDIQAKQA